MPYGVRTDHKVVPFGDNRMVLFETASGTRLVTANRASEFPKWVVHVENSPREDVEADDRQSAIMAMIDLALEKLGGKGYSTTVPHGLLELP